MNKGTRIKGHEQGWSDTNRDRGRDLQKREMDRDCYRERSSRTGTVTDGQEWGMRDRRKRSGKEEQAQGVRQGLKQGEKNQMDEMEGKWTGTDTGTYKQGVGQMDRNRKRDSNSDMDSRGGNQ